MILKPYECKNEYACQAKRALQIAIDSTGGNPLKEAVAMKTTIKEYRKNPMTDIETFLAEEMKDIQYPSVQQSEKKIKDASSQARRYTDCEDFSDLLEGTTQNIPIGCDLEVRLSPDFIRYNADDKTVEVIMLKTGRPSVSQRAADSGKDLPLYAALKYGRRLVSPGETMTVKASYYFLRKDNDSDSQTRPRFDEDFFDADGKNVITIKEEFTGTEDNDAVVTKYDEKAAPFVKAYADGIPKEECTEKDCKECSAYDTCKYEDAPLVLVKTKKAAKTLADLCLTEDQEKAVEYEAGYCRVNAGAGAGKTMVVSLRTATLINKGYDPAKIFLVTYTNAGAEEMRERIKGVLVDFGMEEKAEDVNISTFDAFIYEILKDPDVYTKLGFTSEPKIVDDVEKARIITTLLNQNNIPNLDYKNFESTLKNCKGALAVTMQVFDLVKKKQYSAGEAELCYNELGHTFADITAVRALIELYDQYDELMRNENLVEFSDFGALLDEILHNDPYFMERFGFEHIIVDEFQDSSEKQISLIKELCDIPSFKSLMVVGDDSQAIFSFRDTTPDYMINFDKIMGCETDDIFLKDNHRSTPENIAASNAVNRMRKNRIDKDLVASRESVGKPVVVEGFLTEDEEIQFVMDGIKQHLADGVKPEDIAIIAASRKELIRWSSRLTKEGIQSVMLFPEPIAANSRVRAAIAFVTALKDRNTAALLAYANAKVGGGLMTAEKEVVENAVNEAAAEADAVNAIENDAEKRERILDLLQALDIGEDEVYESFLKGLSYKPTAEKIVQYCEDFIRFDSGATWRRTHSYPGIGLVTCHSSKGLEWPVTYVILDKLDDEEYHAHTARAQEKVEERMRLLYVAMTRARDELIMVSKYDAYGKKGDYTPNQFLARSMEAVGKKLDVTEVEKLRKAREDENAAAAKAARKAKKEQEALEKEAKEKGISVEELKAQKEASASAKEQKEAQK